MNRPRVFRLVRDTDVTGISGEGHIADGVLWPDGTASVRWRGEHPSIVFWDRGRVSLEHVNGHKGLTRIEWLDAAPSGCSCDGDPIECTHEAARSQAEAAVARGRSIAFKIWTLAAAVFVVVTITLATIAAYLELTH